MVALNGVTQPGHVAEDRGQHGGSAEDATSPFITAGEQANRRKQFPDALAPSPPGFSTHLFKNVDRFLSSREFEEQGFDHDASRDKAANPTHEQLTARSGFGIFDLLRGS